MKAHLPALAAALLALVPMDRALAIQTERVAGGGGVELAVDEGGNPDGPAIVFLHGFLGSHATWDDQFDGPLAKVFRLVRMDLRGHGASEKPTDPARYADGSAWAEDLAAVIRAKSLQRPVLVASGFGSVVLGDYLRAYGDEDLGGIVLVGASAVFSSEEGMALIRREARRAIGRALSPEAERRVEGTEAFLPLLTAEPMPTDLYETLLEAAMQVPVEARRGMFARSLDYRDVLPGLSVPVLIVHGEQDRVVRLKAARQLEKLIPGARLEVIQGAGHAPFIDTPGRFERALAMFVREMKGGR